jgi:hypothetical protein
MQLAARLLADGTEKEAAFSRAFKKVAGVAPATWRRRHAARPTGIGDIGRA